MKHVFRIEIIEDPSDKNKMDVRILVKGSSEIIGTALGLSHDKQVVKDILTQATMVAIEEKMEHIGDMLEKDIPDIINELKLRETKGIKN